MMSRIPHWLLFPFAVLLLGLPSITMQTFTILCGQQTLWLLLLGSADLTVTIIQYDPIVLI